MQPERARARQIEHALVEGHLLLFCGGDVAARCAHNNRVSCDARPALSYYIRYFAAQPITSKAIHQALQAVDPTFKIDLGELIRGETSLGQIEVNQAGGDMFNDDLASTLQLIASRAGSQAATPRLRNARSIVVVNLEWGVLGSEAIMELAAPLWSALAQLSPGLSHWDASGIFDGGQPLVDLRQ